jgi:hypothetical protein
MPLLSLNAQTVGSVANLPSGGRALLVHDLRHDGLQRAITMED